MASGEFSLVAQESVGDNSILSVPLWPLPSFVTENTGMLDAALASVKGDSLEKRRGECLDKKVGLLTQKFEAMGAVTMLDRIDNDVAREMGEVFIVGNFDYRERVLHFYQLYSYLSDLIEDGVIDDEQRVHLLSGKMFRDLVELDVVVDQIEQLALHAQRSGQEIKLTDKQLSSLLADNPLSEAAAFAREQKREKARLERSARRGQQSEPARPLTAEEKNARIAASWYGEGADHSGPKQIFGPKQSETSPRRSWAQRLMSFMPEL